VRVNKITLILGKRGTGKTYYTTKQIIPTYRARFPNKRILVVDTHDHPDYFDVPNISAEMIATWKGKGFYRCYDKRSDLVMSNIADYLKNALIIFEDASKYIGRNVEKSVLEFIFDSKQKNLDLIFQFHGFAECAPELLRVCDIIVMFRTGNPKHRANIIDSYEDIAAAYEAIKASTNPYEKRIIKIS
jgi:hypothetical protein